MKRSTVLPIAECEMPDELITAHSESGDRKSEIVCHVLEPLAFAARLFGRGRRRGRQRENPAGRLPERARGRPAPGRAGQNVPGRRRPGARGRTTAGGVLPGGRTDAARGDSRTQSGHRAARGHGRDENEPRHGRRDRLRPAGRSRRPQGLRRAPASGRHRAPQAVAGRRRTARESQDRVAELAGDQARRRHPRNRLRQTRRAAGNAPRRDDRGAAGKSEVGIRRGRFRKIRPRNRPLDAVRQACEGTETAS